MYKLKIVRDEDPPDPREWDNLGKMVCFHGRYNLGDEQPRSDPREWLRDLACDLDETLADLLEYWEEGNGWQGLLNKALGARTHSLFLELKSVAIEESDRRMEAAIQKVLDARAVMLPLYLYDHSGLRMSVGGFSCPWDSGQVGWIYASREDVLKNWGWKVLTKERREHVIGMLKSEVETYDQYLSGDVYGWAVYETDDDCDECDCEPDEECDCTRGADHVDSCWGYYGYKYALEDGQAHAEWLEKDKEASDGTL